MSIAKHDVYDSSYIQLQINNVVHAVFFLKYNFLTSDMFRFVTLGNSYDIYINEKNASRVHVSKSTHMLLL